MFTTRPTDFVGKYKRVLNSAFSAARAEIDRGKLRKAVLQRDEHAVEETMDGPLQAMRQALRNSLPQALAEVLHESGHISYAKLVGRLKANGKLRTAATVKVGGFDQADPGAVAWIEQHAAETIDGISETTRMEIRNLIEQAFIDQFDVDQLTEEIAAVIGDDIRAEEIARTETMTASNVGQQEAWRQAADDGLLTGQEKQEWIVTPDDRLCPDCEDVDGDQVGLDEQFHSEEFGDVDGPPLHPRCRCTVGIVI